MDVKTIKGDGLSLTMNSNDKFLEIIGDGCKISLVQNFGTIRIIGDGCRLKVIQNVGSIEYKGDGGRVNLGPDSDKDKVTYYGYGGHVKFFKNKLAKHPNVKDTSLNLQENQKQKNSDAENDNRENEKREKQQPLENVERSTTVIVTKVICINGECKTNVRTFYNKIDLMQSC